MNSRGRKGKKDAILDASQQKITRFFGKGVSGGGKHLDERVSCVNTVNENKGQSNIKPEVKIKRGTVVQKKNIDKSNDVITLSDSDSNEGRDVHASSNRRQLDGNQNSKVQNTQQVSTKQENSNLSENKAHEKDNITKPDKSGNTPETDSGDEVLSQLDIEEVIRSSQETKAQHVPYVCTTPVKPNEISDVGLEPSYQPNKNRTPTKSPKQKINKFSPIRHLKRSRSNSSGLGESPRKIPFSPRKLQAKHNSKSPSSSPRARLFQDETSGSPAKQKLFYSEPYYLKNFKTVIESVVTDSHNEYLLHEDDKNSVTKFLNLSYAAQCLYVRFFLRKWDWKPMSAIKYPNISENLEPMFDELWKAGFVTEINDEVPSVDKLLDILNASQIQNLAKDMKVDVSKNTKISCKSSLMKAANNQSTIFGSSSSSCVIVRKALQLLGKVYKLDTTYRTIFSRMFILYSLPQYWEDEQVQTSNQLLRILLTDMGNMKYPQYAISRSARIFPDRNELIRFHEAWTLHSEMVAQIEDKNWSDVKEICDEAYGHFASLFDTKEVLKHDSALPSFLRVYTRGSVYARVCWLGVDGYQKSKEYHKSNEVIATLLRQDNIYMRQYRGRWHERFTINMKHLKKPAPKVKSYIESALRDEHILDAHRLILSDRLRKVHEEYSRALERSSKRKNGNEEEVAVLDGLSELFSLKHEIPKMKIEGEKMDNQRQGKSVFLGRQDASGNTTASSVEQFTINYFIHNQGYRYGVHGEGSVVVTILGLLFWDEIYSDNLSDVFHTPYQAFPLDLNFDEFYTRRQSLLMDKLQGMMTTWTLDDALDLLEKNWDSHFDTLSIVSWNVFSSVDGAKSLLRAFGLPVVTKICERLLKNFRHCRSGFPDLVVWNEEKALIVEVKGPGDSLSPKQMLWIDYLQEIGANVTVCHVAAVSNKRIRL